MLLNSWKRTLEAFFNRPLRARRKSRQHRQNTGHAGWFGSLLVSPNDPLMAQPYRARRSHGLRFGSLVEPFESRILLSSGGVGLVEGGLISQAADPAAQGGGTNGVQSMSADGRYSVFVSTGRSLVPGQIDGSGSNDVFLMDLQTSTLKLVDHTGDGVTTSNQGATNPVISADGSTVLFESSSIDLIQGHGQSGYNLYRYDVTTGVVSLVSHTAADPLAYTFNSASFNAKISDDGKTIIYQSTANNVVTGQIDNNTGDDLFVYSSVTNSASLVTHLPGSPKTTASSFPNISATAISGDGTKIIYNSYLTNLVSGQTDVNGTRDLFIYDVSTGVNSIVSHSSASTTTTGNGSAGNGTGLRASISADGSRVVYDTTATNVVAGITDLNGVADVYLYETSTGTNSLISQSLTQSQRTGDGVSTDAVISADGTTIALRSAATNLELGLTLGGVTPLYLYKVGTPGATLITHIPGATLVVASDAPNSSLYDPSPRISNDGSTVAYMSPFSNLVANQKDTNGIVDTFIYHAGTNSNQLVSHTATSLTTTANFLSTNGGALFLSGDGSKVLFQTTSSNLVSDVSDGNVSPDVLVYDSASETNVLISRRFQQPSASAYGSSSPTVNNVQGYYDRVASRDGTYVVFSSDAPNLVTGQVDNNESIDIYLRNTVTNETRIVSHAYGVASTTANGGSSDKFSISDDGQTIVFVSSATNLTTGPISGADQVYAYNVTTGLVTLISHAAGSNSPSDGQARNPHISGDGTKVVYESSSSNLVTGQVGSSADGVYVYDFATNSTAMVTHVAGSPSKASTSASSLLPSGVTISHDGSTIAFYSLATDLVAGQVDQNFTIDLFVYNVSTGLNALISHPAGSPTTASGTTSYSVPSISADGTIIAYANNADNVIPGESDPNGFYGKDVYLYSVLTGTSILVSHQFGNPTVTSSGDSSAPSLSSDGTKVSFISFSNDLIPGLTTFNSGQVFVYDTTTGLSTLVSHISSSDTTAGSGNVDSAVLSANGTKIVFQSNGTNLVAGISDTNSATDIFEYDLATGKNVLLSHKVTNDYLAGNNVSLNPSITSDGSMVIFQTFASDLFANDDNLTGDVVFALSNAFQQQVFTVVNTQDSGIGSLRQALIQSNGHYGTDSVIFDIPGIGAQTINLASVLPAITDAAIIDGTSQPGYTDTPLIYVNGAQIGADTQGNITGSSSHDGFDLEASGITIRGLAIENFSGSGVLFGHSSDSTISGSYLGAAQYRGPADPVHYYQGEYQNYVRDSVGLSDGRSYNNQSYFDGTSLTTQGFVGNGIQFDATQKYVDLGSSPTFDTRTSMSISTWVKFDQFDDFEYLLGDLSSNGYFSQGALTQSSDTQGHHRLGWKQTTDAGASDPYFDPRNGILHAADTATNLTLGTWYHVVVVRDDSAKTVKLYVNGSLDGETTYSGNVYSAQGHKYLGTANSEPGTVGFKGTLDEVGFYNRALSPLEVQSAYMLDTAGDSLGRTGAFIGGGNGWGIRIYEGSRITIGTNGDGLNDSAEGNVISGNAVSGIFVAGVSNGEDTVIAGNLIGTDLSGAAALGNNGDNIRLLSGVRTRIGTNADGISDSAERNVISGTLSGSGIVIDGTGNFGYAGASETLIAGNFIGTDVSGTIARGNQTDGIQITNSANNTIGGVTAVSRNIISGNGQSGVKIFGFTATENLVQGNYIGVDISGNKAIGNQRGVNLESTSDTVIGGFTGTSGNPKPGTGAGNVISGNNTQIMTFNDGSTSIFGNLVGLGADGFTVFNQEYYGILINRSDGDNIGGLDARTRNVIAARSFNFYVVDDVNTLIYNNYIGLDVTGGTYLNYAQSYFLGTRNITIGDVNAGNAWDGNIYGAPDEYSGGVLSGWQLRGNRFGTSADGNLPSTYNPRSINLNAVVVLNVGGFSPGEGNQFNDVLDVEHGGNVRVVGNTFGLNAAGTGVLEGSLANASFYDVYGLTVGSTTASGRNVFASSAEYGVKISGHDSTIDQIQGNYFGTDITGRVVLGSFQNAIIVGNSASGTTISSNVIAQASGAGILVDGGGLLVPDGVIAWFNAENNFENSYGGVSTGTNVGFTSGVAGGQAFSFQRGTGANVASTGTNYLLNADSLTVEGWIDPVSLPSGDGDQFTIAANSDGSSNRFQFSLTNHNGSIQLALSYLLTSSEYPTAYSTSLFGLYTPGFHHVAVVADGNSVKFYLDGQDVSGGDPVYSTPFSSPSTNGTLYIGGNGNADGFDGAIDELAVYNRALDSYEISRIYAAGGLDKGGNGVRNVDIQGNTIGLLADGMTKGSVWDGIHILNSANNYIWTGIAGISNVLSGAVNSAINLDGKYTTDNRISYNVIGLDRSGLIGRGNNMGILLQNGAAHNDISDNTLADNQIGVELDPSAGSQNLIDSNTIGVSGHGNIVGVRDRFDFGDYYSFGYGYVNEVAYNTTGYQGEGAFTQYNSFHDNTELAVDVGDPGVTLTGSPDGLGMAIIDKAVLNPDGTLTVSGFSPFPGAYISIGITGPTATGFGQSQSQISTPVFYQEGSIQDEDSGTGTYPLTFNGHQVAVTPFTANRFQFTYEHFPAGGVINPAFYVGMTLTAMASVLPYRSNEFSPIAIVSDGSIPGGGGQIVSGVAPQIYLPDTVASSSTGILDYAGGYFVDTDSQAWAVTVDFGDGTGSKSISYQAADLGGASSSDNLGPSVARYRFVLNHQYPLSGDYTVKVTVADQSGNVSQKTLIARVSNAAPTIDLSKTSVSPPIYEGQSVTMTGPVSDPNLGDVVTVDVDWGDGSGYTTDGVSLVGGIFTATHMYTDHGTYDVSIRATDSQGKQTAIALGQRPLVVLDTAPSNLNLNLATETLSEGNDVSLPITFYSPSTRDQYTLTVDWGDGSKVETTQVSDSPLGGIVSLDQIPTHRYTNRSGVNERDVISVTLTPIGANTGAGITETKQITVTPVPITVDVEQNFAEEGSLSTFTVNFVDLGWTGGHRLSVNWDDGTTTSIPIDLGTQTSFTLTHVYVDNAPTPAGYSPEFTVSRSSDSTSSRFGSTSAQGVVPNVAPVFVGGISFFDEFGNPLVSAVHEGDTIIAQGTIQDPGINDLPTVTISWGDGTTSKASVDSAGVFKAVHKYVDNSVSVSASVTDKDGDGSSLPGQAFTVLNVAPTIGKVVIQPATAGTATTIQINVADPGIVDTLNYLWTLDGSPLASSNGPAPTLARFDLATIPAGNHVLRLHVVDKDGATADFSTLVIAGNGTLTVTDLDLIEADVISVTMVSGSQDGNVLDASQLSAAFSSYLIGGTGANTMIGGSGYTTVYAPHDDIIDTTRSSGTRIYIDSHSAATIQTSDGDSNALDFSLNSFGVKFDLSLVGSTPAVSVNQDIANTGAGGAANSHFVKATGRISELDGSPFADQLTGTSGATLMGGFGNDTYLVPTGITTGLSILEMGSQNNNQNQVTIRDGATVSGLSVFAGQGAGINVENSGMLLGSGNTAAVNFVQDGTGSGGGIFSFTNTSIGTISGTTSVSTSGSIGLIFTNSGSMSGGTSSPVLSFRGDGTGSGGGMFSFTNTSTGVINGTSRFSTSGSIGVIFTNFGSISGGSNGPVLSFNGDGTGSGGGLFSFTNSSTGIINGATNISTSGSVGIIFTNNGSMSGGSTGTVLSFRGDGTGSGGGLFSFTNSSTGRINGTTTVSTSGNVGINFSNAGSMTGSTGPVLSFNGDGTGSGGGRFSFTNTSTGTINGTTNLSTSGSTGIIFTNSGSMSGGTNGSVLSFRGDGTGSGGGIFSFTNTSTGTINGRTNISTSGSTGVNFTNYGSMSGGTTGPVLSFNGDGTGSGGGIFSFTNSGTVSGLTSVTTSGSVGVIFTNNGGMSAGPSGTVLSFRGDGTGSGGGTFSFTNSGTISGNTNLSTSGSVGVIFTNYGSMSGGQTSTVLSFRGDGTGSGGGLFSFTNKSTGNLIGTTDISTSGSVGVIFTNAGTLSGGATGPVLSFSGDGTGRGGGTFSFTNTSTGTISGTTTLTTSGSIGITFTNSGSMSTGSGPVLSFAGDGTGTGGGRFSFTNTSTGVINGTTNLSTSGSVGIIFTNSGSMSGGTNGVVLSFNGDGTGAGGGNFSFTNSSTGSITGTTGISTSGSVGIIFQNYGSMSGGGSGPVFSFNGDGLTSQEASIAFFNSASGTIDGDFSIDAFGTMIVTFENDGRMFGSKYGETIIRSSGTGKLLAANFGSISGDWIVNGGLADDFVYQAETGSTNHLIFTGGGGSNTLLNQGTLSGIKFDALDSVNPTDFNLLENTHAASFGGYEDDPTIEMLGGAGPNSLLNFAGGTGFVLHLVGGASPDSLYNAAANLPSIKFESGGSPDRGVWTFPLGDVLQNVGNGVGSINYHAPNDSSPDLLLNSGKYVGSITMYGGYGYNLLSNEGSAVSNIYLIGTVPADGEVIPPVSYLTATEPDYGDLPLQANTIVNTGDDVSGITLVGGHGETAFDNSGANVQYVSESAGDDRAEFYNAGSGVNLRNVDFFGSDLDDSFRDDAMLMSQVNLQMNGGDDVVDLRGGSVSDSKFDLGDGNDTFQSTGTNLAHVEIDGDEGDDRFELRGSNAAAITIHGGTGTDLLLMASDNANGITFDGDGTLIAANFGAGLNHFTMTGGTGDASFFNYGDGASSIILNGGAGSNLLENLASTVIDLLLNGGTGSNRLLSARSVVTTVTLVGGTGTNDLDFEGGSVKNVYFTGGDGNDALRITGTVSRVLSFDGGGGNNALELLGTIVANFANILLGSSGNNVAIIQGLVLSQSSDPIVIQGGSGDDRFVILPGLMGNVILAGNGGNNTYVLSQAGNDNFNTSVTIDQPADSFTDTIDFSNFHTSGVVFDLSSVAPQTEGTMTIQLTDGMGISNVIGTPFVDTIIGNGRDNELQGAAYPQSTQAETAATNTRTQWVLVDFDTFTPDGGTIHNYSADERQAVIDQINNYYRGSTDPNSANPWFDVRVTQNPDDIPVELRGDGLASNQYITVFVNATPQNGQPGGESSEIDVGNRHLSGVAVVQVNGALGGAFQPANTSDNFVKLTAKIGAHEIGHLLGLEHSDSVGPIGYGTHLPLYPSQGNPMSDTAPAAFETTDHVISSPASVGSDRFSDLGSLYFSEREDIKLAIAFADPSVIATIQQPDQSTLASPQQIDLVPLNVANTLGSNALNYGKQFIVSAIQIDGDTSGGSDFYRFYATKGQLINADAASVILASSGVGTPFDSTLILRDAAGNIVATNDDSFETSDAQLVDYQVLQSGYYTIEVASADSRTGDYRLTIDAFEAINNPTGAIGIDNLKGGAGVDRFNAGPGVFYGLAITGSTDPDAIQAGATFSRTLSFADPGGYSWTAQVDYGDGAGLMDLPANAIDGLAQTVTLSHLYTKAGPHTVTVHLTNDDGLTDIKSFDVNVSPQAASRFAVNIPTSSTAGSSLSVTVTAFDQFDNLATGYTGTIHFTSTDVQASLPANSLLVNGVGTFTATFKSSGTQKLTATDTVHPTLTGNASVNVIAANATHYVLSAPASGVSGTSFTYTVKAIDSYGNLATSYTGLVHFTSSDGQATLPVNAILVNGTGTFTATLRTVGTQTLTATDTINSLLTQSASVSVLAATSTPKLVNVSIQRGATQRSFIRYLELDFDTAVGLPDFINTIGIKLTRYDINGLNPTNVVLTGLIKISGTHVTIDFGANGIGGNRLTNAGDGTYRLSMDLTKDNSYSTVVEFYRLFGDVNGDGSVDGTDSSLFQAYLKVKDINGDINGDGVVDSRDLTSIVLSQGRKIKRPA